MRPQIIYCAVTLSLWLSAQALASTLTQAPVFATDKTASPSALSPSASVRIGTDSPPTHMLVLKCPSSETHFRGSRAAVLDLGGVDLKARDDKSGGMTSAEMDFGLVAGHGLIGPDGSRTKGCYVQDFAGRSSPVTAMRLARGYRAGTAADWGLIQFPRMETKNLIRYSLRAADFSQLNTASQSAKHSRFASARGRPENGQGCQILPRRRAGLSGEKFAGILAHDCDAVGGQSGAPLSSTHNELLGIHLGTTWTVRSPFTGRPARHGYLRSLDEAMVAQISALAQDMTHTSPDERK